MRQSAPMHRSASCPICHVPMDLLVLQPPEGRPVRLDTCLQCGALWFDRHELADGSSHQLSREHTNVEVAYLCPRCHVHLWAQKLGPDGYWASACIRCDGVFIDGESVDFALSLHPTSVREINAPAPGEPQTTRRRRPRLQKEAPVDYLKDILVESCAHCGKQTGSCRYVLSRSVRGWCCFDCRKELGSRLDDELKDEAIGRMLGRLFDL